MQNTHMQAFLDRSVRLDLASFIQRHPRMDSHWNRSWFRALLTYPPQMTNHSRGALRHAEYKIFWARQTLIIHHPPNGTCVKSVNESSAGCPLLSLISQSKRARLNEWNIRRRPTTTTLNIIETHRMPLEYEIFSFILRPLVFSKFPRTTPVGNKPRLDSSLRPVSCASENFGSRNFRLRSVHATISSWTLVAQAVSSQSWFNFVWQKAFIPIVRPDLSYHRTLNFSQHATVARM